MSRMKQMCLLLRQAFALGAFLLACGIAYADPIAIDGQKQGRTFDGVGAVSAGASSRLLIDYPEPQRSRILDYLFKPNYGAALQRLKVEIGGDVNSTDGCEPSHMHTRDDQNYGRGYEWWLMSEAKKRNPAIRLDCLEWGTPAWIGDGQFYSQDNADYIVKFLQGAKRAHGLDMNTVGIWNETRYDPAWVKLLRRTLDAAGLQRVKIVAADGGWGVAADMAKDPALAAAIDVVGVHYPQSKSPPEAKDLGKPLWSSEDGPWNGSWGGAMHIAQTFNRNYVLGRMTSTLIWSPISAYYDNLPIPESGLMSANQPWSGSYRVQPAIWATAHTAQFTAPGWKYLDSACVPIDGGNVVALKSPNGKNYSVIVETAEANAPQTLDFQTAGLPAKRLHVWRTTEHEYFARQQDIVPQDGRFTLSVQPHGFYSLTTTTGQGKGDATPPAAAPFPLPYHDDFESDRPGATPRFFSDQAGIFEVARRADGRGDALRQVVARNGIEWHSHRDPPPETFLGSSDWTDYEVSVDALIEKAGFVSLFGRVGRIPQNANPPNGFWLKIDDTGTWEIQEVTNPKNNTEKLSNIVLGSGKASFAPDAWHHIALTFAGINIGLVIDGKPIANLVDSSVSPGMAGLGSGWNGAQFDNFAIQPAPAAGR